MPHKILYVITKANWGGAQRYVYDLALAAREAGYDVAVAYGEAGELATKLDAAGIRTIEVPALGRDVKLGKDLGTYFALTRLFRQERPDIVHLNSSKAGAVGALAARSTHIRRILFTSHGWAFNEARPFWQRALLFIAAGITVLLSHETICNSHATRRNIVWFPFARKKLVVVRLGLDALPMLSRETARAALAPRSVGRYWIGMISELHPTKRVADAIRAMPAIVDGHPDTILVVIGEGQERVVLEDLVRDLRLRDHVSLAGFRPEAARLLPAFDLFLHASLSESLGYAILEAGTASLPVVATRVGGIPEIIPNDDYGLLVLPKQPSELAAAVETFMRDPMRAREAGARLNAHVRADFSRERMVRETLALYKR